MQIFVHASHALDGSPLRDPALLCSPLGAGASALERLGDALSSLGESFTIVTDRADAQRIAKRIGAACSALADSQRGQSDGALRLHISGAHPFLMQRDLRALIEGIRKRGLRSAVCIVEQRHHPLSAFIPRSGRMDFSHTLDAPNWRELDETRYYQHSLAFRLGALDRAGEAQAFACIDPRADVSVASADGLALAQALLEEVGDDPNARYGKELAWQSA